MPTGDFNFLPDPAEKALLISQIDGVTPACRDAWDVLYPEQSHPPTVGLIDKKQWLDAPFTFDFVFVSEGLASHVAEVRVDSASDASDHQPMLITLA